MGKIDEVNELLLLTARVFGIASARLDSFDVLSFEFFRTRYVGQCAHEATLHITLSERPYPAKSVVAAFPGKLEALGRDFLRRFGEHRAAPQGSDSLAIILVHSIKPAIRTCAVLAGKRERVLAYLVY